MIDFLSFFFPLLNANHQAIAFFVLPSGPYAKPTFIDMEISATLVLVNAILVRQGKKNKSRVAINDRYFGQLSRPQLNDLCRQVSFLPSESSKQIQVNATRDRDWDQSKWQMAYVDKWAEEPYHFAILNFVLLLILNDTRTRLYWSKE